jgi:MFS transporter, DHA2 family, methylenomycin A resistance protein
MPEMEKSIRVSKMHSLSFRATLAGATLSLLVVPLNSSMIVVALPVIMRDLKVGVGGIGWVVTSYLITMVALQLVAGRMGDRWGRRSTLLGGLAGFGIASLVALLSSSLVSLLAARILQGISGAFLATNSLALAYEIGPVETRGRVLGQMNVALVLAAAAGPLLGGLLIGQWGWRAIFWLNLPLVSIAFLLGWFTIPNTYKPQGQPSLDLHGIVPLFRERTFSCANGVILLMNLVMYLVMLAVPIWMASQIGWTSAQTGLALAVMTILLAVGSPVGGYLTDRRGRRLPDIAGLSILLLGTLLLPVSIHTMTYPFLMACLGLIGAGIGLCSIGVQTAALESVGPSQTGLASGISSISRHLGGILGSMLLTGFFNSVDEGRFQLIFTVAALAALAALVTSLGIVNFAVQKIEEVGMSHI